MIIKVGKPAFENYGNNQKSLFFCYGNHLKTHNVNPHRGKSKPEVI